MINQHGYIDSESIIAFPTSRRIGKAQDSRFLSEKALTRIVNTLIDSDYFVITPEPKSGFPFEFNIGGYYFRINKINDLTADFQSSNDIYAQIKIEKSSSELIGWDDDNNKQEPSVYSGVKFTDTPPKPEETVEYYTMSMQVLHKDTKTGTWTIPQKSKEKFHGGKSFIVDGGIIS